MNPEGSAAETPSTWDWGFVVDILPRLLEGLWLTVKITLLGITLAMVLGLGLAMLRRSSYRSVSWPVAGLIEFVRSTPLLTQLFFLFFVLPSVGIVLPAFTAGVLGLGIHYASYTSESYRAGIDSVERGQWEAATALNLPRRVVWTAVVLPQAIPTVLPALGNYVVAMLKDAPLVSTITVIELLGTAKAIQSESFRGLEPFTLAGVLFLAVSVPAAFLVRLLERRYGFERT